jgi:hypothetical protein
MDHAFPAFAEHLEPVISVRADAAFPSAKSFVALSSEPSGVNAIIKCHPIALPARNLPKPVCNVIRYKRPRGSAAGSLPPV